MASRRMSQTTQCYWCGQVNGCIWISTKCGHHVCLNCLSESDKTYACATCFNGQLVSCINQSCTYSQSRDRIGLLMEHSNTCECRLLPCPNECSAKLQSRTILDHLSRHCPKRIQTCGDCRGTHFAEETGVHERQCPERTVTCSRCESQVLRKDLDVHVTESRCSTDENCTLYGVGCRFRGTVLELDEHLKENTHSEFFVNFVRQAEDIMKILVTEIKDLRSEVERLKQKSIDCHLDNNTSDIGVMTEPSTTRDETISVSNSVDLKTSKKPPADEKPSIINEDTITFITFQTSALVEDFKSLRDKVSMLQDEHESLMNQLLTFKEQNEDIFIASYDDDDYEPPDNPNQRIIGNVLNECLMALRNRLHVVEDQLEFLHGKNDIRHSCVTYDERVNLEEFKSATVPVQLEKLLNICRTYGRPTTAFSQLLRIRGSTPGSSVLDVRLQLCCDNQKMKIYALLTRMDLQEIRMLVRLRAGEGEQSVKLRVEEPWPVYCGSFDVATLRKCCTEGGTLFLEVSFDLNQRCTMFSLFG